MGRRLDIPWIGVSKCHGYGGRYTMGRVVDIQWVGVDIPWIGGSICHR